MLVEISVNQDEELLAIPDVLVFSLRGMIEGTSVNYIKTLLLEVSGQKFADLGQL